MTSLQPEAHIDLDIDLATVKITSTTRTADVVKTTTPNAEIGVPGLPGPTGATGILIVQHGTDPNAARPAVPIVYWVGLAVPANATPTDFWTDQL